MGETEGSSSEEKSQANTKKVDQLDDPFVSLSLQRMARRQDRVRLT
jgi:hypothetical protein